MLCALLLSLAIAQSPALPELRAGEWRAELTSPDGPLPFTFELSRSGDRYVTRIHNGDEVVEVPESRLEWIARTTPGKGPDHFWRFVLDFPHYDAQVSASIEEGGAALDGEWRKRSGPERWTALPFHARAGTAARFGVTSDEPGKIPPAVTGRWKVQFAKDDQPAVAVITPTVQEGVVTGTVLTSMGDFRYLAGNVGHGTLRLSCFDGAHAFLLEGSVQSDGTLKGTFSSGDTWTDTWTGVRDAKAELQDEMSHAHWSDSFGLAQLAYPDLDGNLVSLGDARFAGKVRILQVTGSWCPNCHDETELLAKLDREYRDKGLSITALCFELTGEQQRDTAQARKLLERHGAQYLGLLCGRSDRKLAREALPALDTVFAFPMTVFLHRDGRVRAVHAGFSGPATGPEYEKTKAQFRAIVEELLAEPAPKPTVQVDRVTGELWRDERDRTFTDFERGDDGAWHFKSLEITRFDGPTRTDPVDSGVAVVDGSTVRLGSTILFYDAHADVMLDARDVAHRYTPAARSPFPHVDGAGYSEMPLILEGLTSTDAVRRRESVFYLALQIVQDRYKPPEFGGGQLDPTLAVNILPLVADADPQVRAHACWAAGVVGLEKAIPSLIASLGHGFAPVRREAARALGRLHAADSLAELEKMAKDDDDPLVRQSADESVKALRTPPSPPK
jgi:thiol-disulfide isomerase/thioredoxin